MPNIASLLKSEILRLARREVPPQTGPVGRDRRAEEPGEAKAGRGLFAAGLGRSDLQGLA